MKFKVVIWTAAADADGGTQGASFKTEREAQDWVLEQLETDFDSRAAFEAACAADPGLCFWDYVGEHKRDPHLDTFNIEPQDFEFDELDFDVPFDVPMEAPVRILVQVAGGMVDGVIADCPVEICVIDHDCDGAEEEDLIAIVDADGNAAEVTGHVEDAVVDPNLVDKIFETVRGHWAEEEEPSAPVCGQCEGTGTIRGGLGGDGQDEQCPVCDGAGAADDLESAVTVAEASFQPQPGEVAEGHVQMTEQSVSFLVDGALARLDRIGWSMVNAPGQVRFQTIPDGTAWIATIRKES